MRPKEWVNALLSGICGWIISLACVVAWVGTGRASEVPFDFQLRMENGAYQAALRTLDQDRLDPAKVSISPFPTWATEVISVVPGSQADKAGLLAGSFIHHVNGIEQWSHYQKKVGQVRKYEVVAPDGAERVFNFGPGRVGIKIGDYHRPEKYIYQNIPRGGWDAEMMVVPQVWQRGMNDVGETALRRAMDKGMEWNVFCSYYAAQLALDRGDLQKAKSLLDLLMGELHGSEDIPRFYQEGIRSLSFALRDFDLLDATIADLDGLDRFVTRSEVKEWKRWADAANRRSLVETARKYQGKDLMPRIIPTKGVLKQIRQNLDSLKQGHLVEVGVPGSYYDHLFSPPEPIRDIIWEARVAFEQTGANANPFLNELAFCLVDPTRMKPGGSWDRADWSVARFSIWHDWNNYRFVCLAADPGGGRLEVPRFVPRMPRKIALTMHDHLSQRGPALEIPEKAYFKLALIRLGDEVQILVDDKTFLHLPIKPGTGPLACEIHNVGMALSLKDVTLREIRSPADE